MKANKMNRETRRTKKQIYAAYGIDYDQKTGRIYFPILDKWITPLLVDGNAKIGKTVYHFSTLPGTRDYHLNINTKTEKRISTTEKTFGQEIAVTVLDNDNPFYVDVTGTCICECDNCYAMTGNYVYKTTLAYLAVRTIAARADIDFMVRAIMAQIKADNIKLLRIHASGDFFSVEYIDAWKRIIAAFPGTVFWSYTKNPLAESAFDQFDNCNIVKSRLPDLSLNYGTAREIMDKYAMLMAMGKTVYICRCGIDDRQHCVNCSACARFDYVLFIKHGDKKYDVKKDPLLPAITALIESQDKEIAGLTA